MTTINHKQAFQFLTLNELRKVVPSAFIKSTADVATNYYERVSTPEVLEDLISLGWKPVGGSQMKAKYEKNDGFQKHFIRLRNERLFIGTKSKIEAVPEIMVVNAYSARCRFQMYVGLSRVVCDNYLVFQPKAFGQFGLVHRGGGEILGTQWDNQQPNMRRIIRNASKVVDYVNEYKKLIVDATDQKFLAQEFCKARWNYKYNLSTVKEILEPLRAEDESNDLYTVYNRLQEKIIKGGWTGEGGKKIKPLKNPDREFLTNRRLFEIVEDFYEKRSKKQ